MTNSALIIFTRNPELGKCKTRLAKSIGNEEALHVYKYLLQHTANEAKKVDCTRFVYYSEKIRTKDIWDDTCFIKKQQHGDDLGQRMKNAFTDCFSLGYDKVVIVGSDLLDLSEKIIEKAFLKLNENDAVIGPAEDGGYYLLGLTQAFPEVFNITDWGTQTVYKETIAKLISKKTAVLKILNDIDYLEDLKPYPIFAQYFN